MRLLVVVAWSAALLVGMLGFVGGSGCDRASANQTPAALETACHDATWWSGRSADWGVDTFWIGDARVSFTDAMDRLELPPRSGRDALQAALIVAELELATHPPTEVESRLLPHVYAGHAFLAQASSDGVAEAGREDGRSGGSDRDAARLAEALTQATCGG